MASTTLLLTGRIGNGKSSTGNSILGEKVFKPQSSYASGSAEILSGTSSTFGTSVTVVDGLDIGDLDFKKRKHLKSHCGKAETVLSSCGESISAVVLVLKYGVRFTRQEKEAVSFIRSTFGENVLKTNGIIVMSHGDNFDLDNDDKNDIFENWCAEQTGVVRDLFEECGSRIVLFDNKTKNFEAQKRQFMQLMAKVTKIEQPCSKKELLTSINTCRKSKKSQVNKETTGKKNKTSPTCHIL